MVKVSVVMPSLNQGQFIEEAIQSVLSQSYPAIELLVLDAGSRDNTLQILGKYRHQVWYRSHPDRGQVHAINEGFSRAQGQLLTWLNSDDVLFDDDTIGHVVDVYTNQPGIDAVYGDHVLIDDEGEPVLRRTAVGFDGRCLRYGYCFITPAIFLSREVLGRHGNLDTSFQVAFDWEYYLRLAQMGCKVQHSGTTLFRHRFHQGSTTFATPEKSEAEMVRLQARYCPWTLAHAQSWGILSHFLSAYYETKHWLLRVLVRRDFQLPLGVYRLRRKLRRKYRQEQ